MTKSSPVPFSSVENIRNSNRHLVRYQETKGRAARGHQAYARNKAVTQHSISSHFLQTGLISFPQALLQLCAQSHPLDAFRRNRADKQLSEQMQTGAKKREETDLLAPLTGLLACLLSVLPSPSCLGSSLGLALFPLNPRKNFFPLRVTEPWNRLPREAVESPSLEIFETRLDKVLCSLL